MIDFTSSIKSAELDELLKAIYSCYGYDFSEYALASLKRRIIRFMSMEDIKSVFELRQAIVNDEKMFLNFLDQLTVSVTEMFRDPSFFKSLRENVIPTLKTYPFIKIWDAGCATGEEVYSIAILLKEEGLYERAKIYGTDINQRDLIKAQTGVFPLSVMQDYITNYINSGGVQEFSDYYVAKYNGAAFDESLKKNLVFSNHNLVTDKSFNEFNLIVCRNVLIYFNKNLQNKVIKLFYDSLPMFGYLALGSKESLLFSDLQDHFEAVDKEERIYRKIK